MPVVYNLQIADTNRDCYITKNQTTARYVVKSWWQGVLVTHTQMNRVILKSYYWKDVVQPFQGQPQRGRLQ